MELNVNGEACSFEGTSLQELLEHLKAPPHVAVVINGAVVPRDERGQRVLTDRDEVDLLTLAGGG